MLQVISLMIIGDSRKMELVYIL